MKKLEFKIKQESDRMRIRIWRESLSCTNIGAPLNFAHGTCTSLTHISPGPNLPNNIT